MIMIVIMIICGDGRSISSMIIFVIIVISDRARLSYLITECDYSGHNCEHIDYNCYHGETEAQKIGGRGAVPTRMFLRVHDCDHD